jgi:hypothetical protein
MTISYFPFDSGQGANVTEDNWRKMAQHWINTGVINEEMNSLEVFADSTGMQVKVKSGAAWIKGHYFESNAEEVLPIGSADINNPRIDRIIVRADFNQNFIEFAVLQGVAAISPIAPALTQNTSRWEISLADIRVNAGVSTIAQVNITDQRVYVTNALKGGLAANVNLTEAVDVLLPFRNDGLNFPGETNLASGFYEVPEDGVYEVLASVYAQNIPSAKSVETKLYLDTTVYQLVSRFVNYSSAASTTVMYGGGLVKATKGQKISIYANASATVTGGVHGGYSRLFVKKLI